MMSLLVTVVFQGIVSQFAWTTGWWWWWGDYSSHTGRVVSSTGNNRLGIIHAQQSVWTRTSSPGWGQVCSFIEDWLTGDMSQSAQQAPLQCCVFIKQNNTVTHSARGKPWWKDRCIEIFFTSIYYKSEYKKLFKKRAISAVAHIKANKARKGCSSNNTNTNDLTHSS